MELGEILRRYAAQNDNGAAATGCVLTDLEGRFFAATRLRMTTGERGWIRPDRSSRPVRSEQKWSLRPRR